MEALGQAVFQEAKFEAVEACWCAVGSEVKQILVWKRVLPLETSLGSEAIDWEKIQSSPRSTQRDRGQESA